MMQQIGNFQVLGEPIDIIANPTYLPQCIAQHHDEIWTEPRMRVG